MGEDPIQKIKLADGILEAKVVTTLTEQRNQDIKEDGATLSCWNMTRILPMSNFNPDQRLSHDAPITFKGSTDDNQDVSFTRTENGQTLSNDVNLDQQPYFDSAPTLNNDITEDVVGGKTTAMVYNGNNDGTRVI